jgi:hypothetical protein
MYVIIAYDVNVDRVNKVKKFLRKYSTGSRTPFSKESSRNRILKR